jgi:hypothetical protein
MIYSKLQIEILCDAFRGNSSALTRLMKEAPELAALESALMGEAKPMEWLLKHNKMLAIFVSAVDGNKSAIKTLFAKKEFVWAAVANLLLKDKEAEEWLKKQGQEHFVQLAECIRDAQKKHSGFGFV